MHQGIYGGRTTVVMDRFDLGKFCSLIQEHKITYAYVRFPPPPAVYLQSPSFIYAHILR